ncbi:hypothetical protein [Pseudorhodobacter sp.]|uniref:hypothetical protein n=1 Tax=Pseudorhodobacter sp. TaxID=1934400 RepID=UPI0026472A57|nr:hypothetical protein [Pseudorhodobacter sp.]MDN5785921.1 hypothetical protein [Pseudorhodobacter sp.]
MQALLIVGMGLQGAVFALWAVVMFRTLFRLRAQAVAETGHAFPGPLVTLRTFLGFLTRPEYQRDRRMLLALTLLLFAMIGGLALLAPGLKSG